MNKNTDKIVLDLLKKVEEKKLQIGSAERPSWVTNCSFGFDPNNNSRINIQVVRELEQLVEIYAFLYTKYNSFYTALASLNLTDKDVYFKYLGFTFEQWAADIKTRINSLRIKNQKDELAALEARVNALVSHEQRREIELEKLVKEIG